MQRDDKIHYYETYRVQKDVDEGYRLALADEETTIDQIKEDVLKEYGKDNPFMLGEKKREEYYKEVAARLSKDFNIQYFPVIEITAYNLPSEKLTKVELEAYEQEIRNLRAEILPMMQSHLIGSLESDYEKDMKRVEKELEEMRRKSPILRKRIYQLPDDYVDKQTQIIQQFFG